MNTGGLTLILDIAPLILMVVVPLITGLIFALRSGLALGHWRRLAWSLGAVPLSLAIALLLWRYEPYVRAERMMIVSAPAISISHYGPYRHTVTTRTPRYKRQRLVRAYRYKPMFSSRKVRSGWDVSRRKSFQQAKYYARFSEAPHNPDGDIKSDEFTYWASLWGTMKQTQKADRARERGNIWQADWPGDDSLMFPLSSSRRVSLWQARSDVKYTEPETLNARLDLLNTLTPPRFTSRPAALMAQGGTVSDTDMLTFDRMAASLFKMRGLQPLVFLFDSRKHIADHLDQVVKAWEGLALNLVLVGIGIDGGSGRIDWAAVRTHVAGLEVRPVIKSLADIESWNPELIASQLKTSLLAQPGFDQHTTAAALKLHTSKPMRWDRLLALAAAVLLSVLLYMLLMRRSRPAPHQRPAHKPPHAAPGGKPWYK